MAVRKDKVQIEVEINGQKASSTYRKLQKSARALRLELQGLKPGTEAFIKKSAELKKVNDRLADIRLKTRGVATAMKRAGLNSGLFTRIIGTATGVLAGFLAKFSLDRLIDFGKRLVGVGVQSDALARKALTVLGNELDSVKQKAAENARAMGLTERQYISATTAAADLLVPMGFTRKEAASLSTGLLDLSGALAEWTGGQKSATEVSDILNKALLGEREQLKTLGIAIRENDVTNRLREKGLDKLTGRLLEQAKASATLELIMEKSKDAQAAFARNTDGTVRSQAELNASLNALIERLGQRLLPAYNRLLRIGRSLIGFAERFAERTGLISNEQERASEKTRQLQVAFNGEIEVLKRANLSQEERAKLINEINGKYGSYLGNLLSEKASLKEIETAQKNANEAFKQKILLQELVEVFERQKDAIKSASAAEKERARVLSGNLTRQERALQNAPVSDFIKSQDEIAEGFAAQRDASLFFAEEAGKDADKVRESYEGLAKQLGTTMDDIFKRFKAATEEPVIKAPVIEKEIKKKKEEAQETPLIDQLTADNERKLEAEERFLKTQNDLRSRLKTEAKELLEIDNEGELAKAEEHFQMLLEAAEVYGVDTLEFERFVAEGKKAVQEEYANAVLEQGQEIFGAERDLQLSKLKLYQTVAAQIGAIAGENSAVAIAAFALEKAAGIAQVIVNLQKQLAAIRTQYAVTRAQLAATVIGNALVPGTFALEAVQVARAKVGAATGIATIAGSAVARFVKKARGGRTGTGRFPADETGERPAEIAVLHENEWVAPRWQVQHPVYGRVIDWLEAGRIGRKAEGGFASVDTTPRGEFFSDPVNIIQPTGLADRNPETANTDLSRVEALLETLIEKADKPRPAIVKREDLLTAEEEEAFTVQKAGF